MSRRKPEQIASFRNRVARADHPNLVIGELHRNIHHLRFLHVAANAVLARDRASLCGMVRGGFRHLVVIEQGEIAGLLSMRDVVRCWTQEGATSEMPS